ncbi:MAG: hypothetical protein IPM14_07610 [bacterium]|nr:hypothetical protein [bacterium]
MKFSRISFHFTIWVLSISILVTGCHTYFTIPKDDYNKIESMEDIKIVYMNGKEFVVEKNDTNYVKVIRDSLTVHKGIEETSIDMDEVDKIKEMRFDLGGTITLVLLGLTLIVIGFYSTFDTGG